MSSEEIQSGRKITDRTPPPTGMTYTGRVLVRGQFEFWHPATVECYTSLGATVVFDNMDEATVPVEDLLPPTFYEGEVAFLRDNLGLGVAPALIAKVLHEALELEFLDPVVGRYAAIPQLLRDICAYRTRLAVPWSKRDRVFAYLPCNFNPPLPLLFPGVVEKIHYGSCVEIDFDDGEQKLVAATLVQPLELTAGDLVYARNDYWSHGTMYSPCRVLERSGDELVVQNDIGEVSTTEVALIGVLLREYQFPAPPPEEFPD